ncbi:TetR family transcriptional regulator C-terminal domain-containing protein [Streptomyces sp. NPDC026673]|uniref:TetR family transcriptional regulator C-terminal domain-containing protein n=1 Tax=Streptomyces sp. NPDC026673 TaxID=3155724 RepID=UPI0033CA9260
MLDDSGSSRSTAPGRRWAGPARRSGGWPGCWKALPRGYGSDLRRRGCLLVNSTSELHGREPEVVDRSRVTYQEMEDLLAACVKEAQREGDLDPEADPQVLGRLLLAVLHGMEFLAKTRMDAEGLLEIGRAALARLPRP